MARKNINCAATFSRLGGMSEVFESFTDWPATAIATLLWAMLMGWKRETEVVSGEVVGDLPEVQWTGSWAWNEKNDPNFSYEQKRSMSLIDMGDLLDDVNSSEWDEIPTRVRYSTDTEIDFVSVRTEKSIRYKIDEGTGWPVGDPIVVEKEFEVEASQLRPNNPYLTMSGDERADGWCDGIEFPIRNGKVVLPPQYEGKEGCVTPIDILSSFQLPRPKAAEFVLPVFEVEGPTLRGAGDRDHLPSSKKFNFGNPSVYEMTIEEAILRGLVRYFRNHKIPRDIPWVKERGSIVERKLNGKSQIELREMYIEIFGGLPKLNFEAAREWKREWLLQNQGQKGGNLRKLRMVSPLFSDTTQVFEEEDLPYFAEWKSQSGAVFWVEPDVAFPSPTVPRGHISSEKRRFSLPQIELPAASLEGFQPQFDWMRSGAGFFRDELENDWNLPGNWATGSWPLGRSYKPQHREFVRWIDAIENPSGKTFLSVGIDREVIKDFRKRNPQWVKMKTRSGMWFWNGDETRIAALNLLAKHFWSRFYGLRSVAEAAEKKLLNTQGFVVRDGRKKLELRQFTGLSDSVDEEGNQILSSVILTGTNARSEGERRIKEAGQRGIATWMTAFQRSRIVLALHGAGCTSLKPIHLEIARENIARRNEKRAMKKEDYLQTKELLTREYEARLQQLEEAGIVEWEDGLWHGVDPETGEWIG